MLLFFHVMNSCFLYQVTMRNLLVEVRKAKGKLETANLVEKNMNEAETFLLTKLDKDDLDKFNKLPEGKKREVFDQMENILSTNGKGGQDYQDIEQIIQSILPKI